MLIELSLEGCSNSIPHLHSVQLLLIQVQVIRISLQHFRLGLMVSIWDLQVDIEFVDPESLQLGELGLDCLR